MRSISTGTLATTALYLAKRKDVVSPLVAAFVEVAAEAAARHSGESRNPC